MQIRTSAMNSFVHPFRKAKFWGVPLCFFDKLGRVAGEHALRKTGLVLTFSKEHGVSKQLQLVKLAGFPVHQKKKYRRSVIVTVIYYRRNLQKCLSYRTENR
jgi:hypothetical protein